MHGAVQITRDLVAIPSVNPMGTGASGDLYSERHIADYVESFCHRLRLDARVTAKNPDHPNVIISVDAGLPETLLLEAHMDTVSHENMVIDPFDPAIRDLHLYGRGSCDTKASLAIYLHAASVVIEQGRRLKRNLIIAGVHDEEYSFGGSRELIASGLKATFAIVGEPTSLNMVHGHKGVSRLRVQTQGVAAHAAMPWLGKNAIYKMADVLHELRAHAEELQAHSHPELGPATLSVGRIYGGFSVNMVPPSCTIEIDRRLLREETPESAQTMLVRRLAGLGDNVKVDPPYVKAPSFYTAKDSLPCRLLADASQSRGWDPEFQTGHYATDASILSGGGIPAVVFGPGSIALAHTEKECVPISEIELGSDIVVSLLTAE